MKGKIKVAWESVNRYHQAIKKAETVANLLHSNTDWSYWKSSQDHEEIETELQLAKSLPSQNSFIEMFMMDAGDLEQQKPQPEFLVGLTSLCETLDRSSARLDGFTKVVMSMKAARAMSAMDEE